MVPIGDRAIAFVMHDFHTLETLVLIFILYLYLWHQTYLSSGISHLKRHQRREPHHSHRHEEGSPIILVHGLFGNANTLHGVGEGLSSHLPSHAVYTVDMRNHGHSPRSPVHTYPGGYLSTVD